MWCQKCNTDLVECECPDLDEKMRELTGEDGYLGSRWCVSCDKHYALCLCTTPDWALRISGRFAPLPSEAIGQEVKRRKKINGV